MVNGHFLSLLGIWTETTWFTYIRIVENNLHAEIDAIYKKMVSHMP